jgi:hypothetical protein
MTPTLCPMIFLLLLFELWFLFRNYSFKTCRSHSGLDRIFYSLFSHCKSSTSNLENFGKIQSCEPSNWWCSVLWFFLCKSLLDRVHFETVGCFDGQWSSDFPKKIHLQMIGSIICPRRQLTSHILSTNKKKFFFNEYT